MIKKILILMAVLSCISLINAGDVDIYGNLGLASWWMRSSKMHVGTIDTNSNGELIIEKDSLPLNTTLMKPCGILGFKFKGDRFGGCVEMRAQMNLYDSRLSGSPTYMPYYKKNNFFMLIEKFYGEWYLNDYFTVLFGQDYAPTNFFPSNQGYDGGRGLHNVGCLYTGAYPMFQIAVHSENKLIEGKFSIVKVDTSVIEYFNELSHAVHYHCETDLPKFEGSFAVNLDKEVFGLNVKVAGGIQRYKTVAFKKQILAKDARIPILSYVAGSDLSVRVGPVTLSWDVFYGQNIGVYGVKVGYEYGWWRLDDYMRPYYPVHLQVEDENFVVVDTTLDNSRAFETAVILNVTPLEWLSLELGGGLINGKHENKDWDKNWKNVYAAYFQPEIRVFDQLKFTPEGGIYVYGPYRGFVYWGMNTIIGF